MPLSCFIWISVSARSVMVITRHGLDNPPIITIVGRQVETVNHFFYAGNHSPLTTATALIWNVELQVVALDSKD